MIFSCSWIYLSLSCSSIKRWIGCWATDVREVSLTCPNLPKIAQTPHLPIFAQDCLDCVCVASAEPGGPGQEPTDPAFSGDPSKHTGAATRWQRTMIITEIQITMTEIILSCNKLGWPTDPSKHTGAATRWQRKIVSTDNFCSPCLSLSDHVCTRIAPTKESG